MPRFNIENINYIVAGETEKIINVDAVSVDNFGNRHQMNGLSNWSFLTDENLDYDRETFAAYYDSHRLKRIDNDIDEISCKNVIYALFDFKDVAVKSDMLGSKYRMFYGPHLDENPIGFCQATGSNAFGMTEPVDKSINLHHTDLKETRYTRLSGDINSLDWQYKLGETGNPTYTYIPLSNLILHQTAEDKLSLEITPDSYYDFLKSYKELSSSMLSTLFIPRYDHKNVEKNYIYEMFMTNTKSTEYKWNQFNNGDIYSNMIVGKNTYDSTYSENQKTVDSLKNARFYNGIGSVGGHVFLKYYDETQYQNHDIESTNLSAEVKEYNSNQTKPVKNSYQNVEILESINRFTNKANHKSNLYSIRINNLNLESYDELQPNLDKIKSDISKSVRMIAEELSPAHTQLFKVYVN